MLKTILILVILSLGTKFAQSEDFTWHRRAENELKNGIQIGKCLKPDISLENEPASRCKCFIDDSFLNVLQCSDPEMTELPVDFTTDNEVEFSYVTFLGSSVKSLTKNQFTNLRLAENAKMTLSGIEQYADDVFSEGIITSFPFHLIIRDSLLNTLEFFKPFNQVSLKELEFFNFSLPEFTESNFDGCKIETLSFTSPRSDSFSPYFVTDPYDEYVEIKRLKIENVGDIFRKNSKDGRFGVDYNLLNVKVFSELEELAIINTNLDYIEPIVFTGDIYLKNIHTVRFENIGLKDRILEKLDEKYEMPNWLGSSRLKRVYLGIDSQLSDEFLCYFVDINEQTQLFIYDSSGSSDGIYCTCTVYWIYRNYNFSISSSDPDWKYIPYCLKNKENVQQGLQTCLNYTNPLKYCKGETETTLEETTLPVTTKIPTTDTKSNELKYIYDLMIVQIVCMSVLIVGVGVGFTIVLIFIFKIFKKTSTTVSPSLL